MTLVLTGSISSYSLSLSLNSRALPDELLLRELDSSFICLMAAGVCITGSTVGSRVTGTGLIGISRAIGCCGYLKELTRCTT